MPGRVSYINETDTRPACRFPIGPGASEGEQLMAKGNSNSKEEPDYAALDLPDPDEVPHDEWHWTKRRAYLYREWLDHGTHQLLNKTQLAKQFDVTRNTIYNDLDKIAEFVEQNMARHHGAETTAVFQRVVSELIDDEEWEKAAKVQNTMSDWLERRGAIDKEPDKQQIAAEVRDSADLDEEDADWVNEVF